MGHNFSRLLRHRGQEMNLEEAKTPQIFRFLFSPTFSFFISFWQLLTGLLWNFDRFLEFWKSWFWQCLPVFKLFYEEQIFRGSFSAIFTDFTSVPQFKLPSLNSTILAWHFGFRPSKAASKLVGHYLLNDARQFGSHHPLPLLLHGIVLFSCSGSDSLH